MIRGRMTTAQAWGRSVWASALVLMLTVITGPLHPQDAASRPAGQEQAGLQLSLRLAERTFGKGGIADLEVSLANRLDEKKTLSLLSDAPGSGASLKRLARVMVADANGTHRGIGTFRNFNRGPDRVTLVLGPRETATASVRCRLGHDLIKGSVSEDLPEGSYELYVVLGDQLGGWFGSKRAPPLRSNAVKIKIGPKLRVSDLGWLTGSWKGGQDGQVIEETWSAPAGGSMVGMFRWRAGDKTRFFELLLLEEDAQGVALRFKHIGPGWKPWEKDRPLTFRVSQEQKGRAVFRNVLADQSPKRVVYELLGKDRLSVTVEATRDGKPETFKLSFRREGPTKK